MGCSVNGARIGAESVGQGGQMLGAEAYLKIGGGELSPGGQKLIAGGERREGSTTLRHS